MYLAVKDAIRFQKQMSKQVVQRDVMDQEEIKYICGVDVSYRGDRAFSAAVIVERKSLVLVDSACNESVSKNPYIPGLLFLREAEAVLEVLGKLHHSYDLLMIDGHGLLHPRRFGIACYIGLIVDKPTIGVGKSLLCGIVVGGKDSETVLLDGKKLGTVVRTRSKPVYVSVGHKISLRTAVELVKELSRYIIPEPLRLADITSRMMASHA